MKQDCAEFVNVREVASLEHFLENVPDQNLVRVTNDLYVVTDGDFVVYVERGKLLGFQELKELHVAYKSNRLHFLSAYEVTR